MKRGRTPARQMPHVTSFEADDEAPLVCNGRPHPQPVLSLNAP